MQRISQNTGKLILIVFLFSLCRLRITTQLRSGAVDKMAGMFQNALGNPTYVNQTKLNWKLRKNWGNQTGYQAKIWGCMAHPGPPLESPLGLNFRKGT